MCSGCLCAVGCECWRYKDNDSCGACGFYAYQPEHKGDACGNCGRAWTITITGSFRLATESVQDAIAEALAKQMSRRCIRGLARCA